MRVFALLLLLPFLCGPAAAEAMSATTIIGSESPEGRACYLAAEARDVTAAGLRHCDAALAQDEMSAKNRVATYVNRGILLSWARRYKAALDDLEQALALSPGLPEAYANRGNVYLMKGQLRMAVADYTRAIEGKSPKLFAVYFCRGLAYEAQGRVPQAIADFKAALKLNPEFREARDALEFYHALA